MAEMAAFGDWPGQGLDFGSEIASPQQLPPPESVTRQQVGCKTIAGRGSPALRRKLWWKRANDPDSPALSLTSPMQN